MIVIESITITPNPVDINGQVKISIGVSETSFDTWQDLLNGVPDWNTLKNNYSSWGEILNG